MKQFNLKEYSIEFFSSAKIINFFMFLIFTLLMTIIISSQNFFFQRVVENGISKRDIIAEKTITVIDTKRTEKHKKEIAQKIEPILTTANDEFIRTNLTTLQNSIFKIREKEATNEIKQEELGLLFDFSDETHKNSVVNFLLKANDNEIKTVFEKSKISLENTLSAGVSEKDYEQDNIRKIIQRNMISGLSRYQTNVITALLEQIITPNLIIDEFATDIARKNAQNSVKPYEITFKKGDKILFEGEPVTKLKEDALRQAGYNLVEVNFAGVMGIFLFVAFSTFLFKLYHDHFETNHFTRNQMYIFAILTIFMALIAVVIPTGFSPYILPLPAYILILAIFTNPRIAFIASTLLLGTLTLALQYNIQFVVSFALINLVCAIAISEIRFSQRLDLIKTGFKISVCGVIIVACVYLLEKFLIEVNNILIIRDTIFIFVNGILSSIIALGTLPLLENTFKIITPYGLAELADHNQPLLKRLQFEAPGTYHHSLMVSNLCEAAAESIGANPVLARVGAFYHDIGKLKRPLFFVENQSYFGIENPHTKLNPRLSKMVITAHPKDGVELAKEYSLPPIIHNFILQHHGEGLASYFYNQAIAEEGADNVKEEQFRYTGPKPNSKETAILMIADAVESAVRSLKNPTPEEIEQIIDKIIIERLNDGQLSDSPLTLRDIKTVASCFNRILRGMQHNRIKYHQDMIQEFDKSKIIMPNLVIDSDLDKKIQQMENAKNEENKD